MVYIYKYKPHQLLTADCVAAIQVDLEGDHKALHTYQKHNKTFAVLTEADRRPDADAHVTLLRYNECLLPSQWPARCCRPALPGRCHIFGGGVLVAGALPPGRGGGLANRAGVRAGTAQRGCCAC
jgi:hypothetical protein